MNSSKFLSIAFLTGAMILSATVLFAAIPPTATPIDGGLSLVIAACAGYGVKKIRDSRKQK